MKSQPTVSSRFILPPYFSPWRVLVYIIVAGGVTELLMMVLFYLIPPSSILLTILLDAALTIVVVFPAISIGLMRPLRRIWNERREAQIELALAHQELEQRVQERTSSLAQVNAILQQEILERKKVEEALLEKRTRMQFFLHQIPAILWSTDKQLNITYAAGAGLTMRGIQPDNLVGVTLNEFALVNPDHFVYLAHKRVLDGEPAVYEVERDGYCYQVHLEPFLDADGNISGSIGMAMDITEQKQAQKRLHLQTTALDAAANGIMITDRHGTIQWANQALSQMTGFPLEDILGKTPRFMKSGKHDRDFYETLWETILAGKVWQGEMTNRRKDGSIYIEEQTITPVISDWGELLHFVAIKQDITTRVHVQRQIQRRNLELARLNEIATIVSRSLDEHIILKDIQHLLAAQMRFPIGRIFRFHETDKHFHLDAWWGIPEAEARSFSPLPYEAFPNQQVIQEQIVVMERDLTHSLIPWTIYQEKTKETWMRHIWTPLTASGQVLGVLELFGNISAIDFQDDSHFFQVLGGQVGMALQNAQLYKAEMRAREIADSLRQAGLAISHSLNLDTVFNTLLDFFGSMVAFDYAFIAILESEDHFIVRASRGSPLAYPFEVLPLDFDLSEQPLLKELLETGEDRVIPDTHAYFNWDVCPARVCVRSWVILPLKMGGKVQGLCSLGKVEPAYYNAQHIQMITSLVSQAAVAIQNAWLFDQVSTGHDRLQYLSRQLVNLQENERAYVARELHDETSQALASILVGLGLISRSVHDPKVVADGVVQLEELVGLVMDELHEIAVKLRPVSLDHLGLVDSLRQYVEDFRRKYRLSAYFETFGSPVNLNSEVKMALYRITQEALTNVARHAYATRIDVVLEFCPDEIALLIEDNGIGFKPLDQPNKDHLGLLGIRERVEMLGGSLLIDSTPSKGTTIKVTIPRVGMEHKQA